MQIYELISEKIKVDSNLDSVDEFLEAYAGQNEQNLALRLQSDHLNNEVTSL